MTVIEGNKMKCLNCNGEFVIKMPIRLDFFIKQMQAFEKLHKYCKEKIDENSRA